MRWFFKERALTAFTGMWEQPRIHMLFMKFPIDVIFIDRANTVVGLCPNIRPFQFSPFFPRAHSAIETPAGTIAASQTQMGDSIQIG